MVPFRTMRLKSRHSGRHFGHRCLGASFFHAVEPPNFSPNKHKLEFSERQPLWNGVQFESLEITSDLQYDLRHLDVRDVAVISGSYLLLGINRA